MRDEFEENFNKKRKFIKRIFIGMFVFCILAVSVQIWTIYYGVSKIQENGGLHETAVSILKEINSIVKEAESK